LCCSLVPLSFLWSRATAARASGFPIAAYSFDENEGTVAHDSEGSLDGEIKGATWTTGRFGAGLEFDAEEEDVVEIPNSESLRLTGFTLEAWVRPHEAREWAAIISKTNSEDYGYALYAGGEVEGLPEGLITKNNWVESYASGLSPLTPESWTFLALTSNGAKLRLYVNGELVDERSAPKAKAGEGPLLIGGGTWAGSEYFDGTLDEVRLYDFALDQEEVQEDEGTALGHHHGPNPIAAYSFNEGEGEMAEDSAGAHDGTVEGAEWEPDGRFGGALSFDAGNEDEVDIPGTEDLRVEDFTVEAWVKPDKSLEWAPVIARYSPEDFGFALDGGGELAGQPEGLITNHASAASYAYYEHQLPLNKWSYLALTSDGSDLRLYLNGELVDSRPSTAARAGVGDLEIGGSSALGSGEYFDGEIDEARLFDRALTEDQITEDMFTPVSSSPVSEGLEISAEGSLLGEGLASPEGSLKLEVTDSAGKISQVNILVDGQLEESIDAAQSVEEGEGGVQECEEESCTFSIETSLGWPEVESGDHQLEITATDEHGNSTAKKYPIALDAEPPELQLYGPLAELEGASLETESSELLIRARDWFGAFHSGVAEVLVLVDGNLVKTLVNPCEATCVEPAEFEYIYSEEEWGTGPREVEIIAIDRSGNSTNESLQVNAETDAVLHTCQVNEPQLVSAGNTVNAEEAIEQLESWAPSSVWSNADLLMPESELPVDPFLGETTLGDPPTAIYEVENSLQGGFVEDRASGGVSVAQAACLQPEASTSEALPPTKVSGAPLLMFPDTGGESDTAVRATALGATILESFRGTAPEQLSWDVSLEPEEELVELASGALAIVEAGGMDLSGLEVPEVANDPNDPGLLNRVGPQAEAALAEVAAANNEITGKVLAVVASPVSLDSEGKAHEAPISVDEDGHTVNIAVPGESRGVILRTQASISAPAICAEVFSSTPWWYQSGCGADARSEEHELITDERWSADESIFYTSYAEEGEGFSPHIYHLLSNGDAEAIAPTLPFARYPAPSLDGSEAVFEGCNSEQCGIYAVESNGEDLHLLFATSSSPAMPTMTVDGEHVLFYDEGGEPPARQLFSAKLDGTEKKPLTSFSGGISGEPCPAAETADEAFVVLCDEERVLRLPSIAEAATRGSATVVVGAPALSPSVSPDGTKVIYSDDAGIWEVGLSGEASPELMIDAPAKTEADKLRVPSLSPDESEVAYVLHGFLVDGPVSGGKPSLLAPPEDTLSLADAVGDADTTLHAELEAMEEGLAAAFASSATFDYPAPNGPEEEFCEANIQQANECRVFYGDKLRAEGYRDNLFTGGNARKDTSTRGNAFQHGFWTASMDKDSTRTHEIEGIYYLDGLYYALLHEGPPPWRRDAKMDILNDFVGNKFWIRNATNGGPELHQEDVCEGIRKKNRRAIHISRHKSPFRWAHEHEWQAFRLIFRLYRTGAGTGIYVRPTGRTCAGGAS